VPRNEVKIRGGKGLFYHHASLASALQAAYPQYAWDTSQFKEKIISPTGFWKDNTNLHNALAIAEKKLGIRQASFLL